MEVERNFNPIRTEIIIVQNTLNFDVFGALIRIENLLVQDSEESAEVDFFITIPEVNNEFLIQENLVKVNSIGAYRGNTRDEYVQRLPGLLVREWNAAR